MHLLIISRCNFSLPTSKQRLPNTPQILQNNRMGGNALKLKGITPDRIPGKELQKLINDIPKLLVDSHIFKWILPTKSYHLKTDHGDLDFIGELSKENTTKQTPWQLQAKALLKSKAIYWNKPVASLEYKNYQIDLTGRENYEKANAHLEFSHYSPLGNILGRLIKKTGAKWGIDGLQYQIKEKETPESQIIKTITLSTNIDDILKLCGLNPKTWHEGFNTQEELFSYACQNKLFNKDMFKLENLNHTHRKRDRTRPDYHQWLAYIESNLIPDKTSWMTKESPQEYKTRVEYYQIQLDKEFPGKELLKTIKAEREKSEFIKLQKKEKFNGELISNWTQLQGCALGNFIKEFKIAQSITSQDQLIKWITSNNKMNIKRSILDHKKQMEDKVKYI